MFWLLDSGVTDVTGVTNWPCGGYLEALVTLVTLITLIFLPRNLGVIRQTGKLGVLKIQTSEVKVPNG